jgi:hypothetical protein
LDQVQYHEAIPLFEKALSIDPKNINVLNNLALCYQLIEDPQRRDYLYFKRITEIDPNHSNSHHNVGHLCHGYGYIDEAQYYLERAYELDPNFPETCHSLAVLYNGFTLKKPHVKASDVLFKESQVNHCKSNHKQILTLDSSIPFTVFDFDNAIVSLGQILVNDTFILLHHNLKIPVHRWKVYDLKAVDTVWTVLQHNSWVFYHWLVEQLPKVYLIIHNYPEPKIPIIVPNKPFVRDSLKDIDWPFIYMTDTESFYVNHLKVIDWPTIDTSGQVLAKEYLPPSYAIDILRSNLRLTRGQSKYVVWLSRKHVSVKNNRNIQNEDLVLENLVKTCPGYEVLNFIPENYSIEQTKDIFSQAKIVVGVHGGAFSNIVYCSGDTSVIEFTMLEEYYRYYFKYLSDLCKLKYYEIQLNNPNLFTIPFILPDNALDNLQNIIKNILL